MGQQPRVAASLLGMGSVAAARGDPERAARLLGAATAMLERLDAAIDVADRRVSDRDMEGTRAALDNAAFQAAWEAGRAMSLDEAVALALEETETGAS
jgi:non-specific serine/threonine protein kinase